MMKKIILSILMIFIAAFTWISAGLLKYNMNILPGIMKKYIPLKISPLSTGGYPIKTVTDNIDDAVVPDGYTVNAAGLDIVEINIYTVSVGDKTKFQNNIEIVFNNLTHDPETVNGFNNIEGTIYIESENSGSGKHLEPAIFDNINPDMVIVFNPSMSEAIMTDLTTSKKYPVNINFNPDAGSLIFKVPVITEAKITRDSTVIKNIYAEVRLYSPGAKTTQTADITGNYSTGGLINASLPALLDDKTGDAEGKSALTQLDDFIASDSSDSMRPSDYSLLKNGIDAYESGDYGTAKDVFTSYPNSPAAAAYIAIITASEAGSAKSLDAKLNGVYSAYVKFESALRSAKLEEDKICILKLRSSLSLNVPDEIFNKRNSAITDLNTMLSFSKTTKKERAGIYKKLINIYMNDKNQNKLRMTIEKAMKMIE